MRFPLFGIGLQGKSPIVTAKKLQNMFAEIRPMGEQSQIVAYGTPGLQLFVDFGDTPPRGGIYFEPNDVAYVVHRGTLWEINNAGATTNRGSLGTTSGRVSLAHNGVQVMIVDGTNGYIYNTSTTVFAQIVDADFPPNPQTVTFNDSYFIVNKGGTGRFYISAQNDGTSWAALDFSTADSNPDDLIHCIADGGELVLWGPVTTEFWADTGAASFPYSRIPGSTMEWGLAARWSVAKYDNTLVALMKSRMGEVMVAKLNGHLPQKISTPDFDAVINGYARNSGIADASGFSYMVNGHPMYQLNFTAAGMSWLYDGSTGIWSPVKGYGITRHRAEFGFNFINSTVVADYSNGRLYRLKSDVYTDNGAIIEREIIGEHISDQDLERFCIDRIRLDMETGVGLATGQGSNPQAMLQVSKDGGKTWGRERWASIKAMGNYRPGVEWNRFGQAQKLTVKIRITDPIPVAITNASVNPQD